jgi:hypothetical protein
MELRSWGARIRNRSAVPSALVASTKEMANQYGNKLTWLLAHGKLQSVLGAGTDPTPKEFPQ